MALCAENICTCGACEEVRAKGGWASLKSRGPKFNSPVHKGCDCYIVPETVVRAGSKEWMKGRGIELEKGLNTEAAAPRLEELQRLPDNILTTFKTNGGKLRIIKGGVTTQPEYKALKGKVPRGWRGTGYTWDDVPGIANDIILASVSAEAPHGSMALARHELGHKLDKFKGISDTNEFRALYNRLLKLDRDGDINLLPYFKQSGFAGRHETFAEFLAGQYSNAKEIDTAFKAGRLVERGRWGSLGKNITDEKMQPVIDWWESIVKEVE